MPSLVSAVVVAALVAVASADVKLVYSEDAPTQESMKNKEYPECSSFYRVDLSSEYTTQGNDLGMSPMDGRNTDYATSNLKDTIKLNFDNEYTSYQNIGEDRVGFPKKNDAEAQALARSLQSVTALTDSAGTPNGFHRAVIHQYYGVCVEVVGIKNTNNRKNNIGVNPRESLGGRWIEVMAQTTHANQAVCVTDFGRLGTHDDPVHSACGQGDLYTCREANLPIIGAQGGFPTYPAAGDINSRSDARSGAGSLMLKFHCESNCDDPLYAFYFRITASQERPELNEGRLQQRDGENWCAMRDGDDYPSSLLEPYPRSYVEPVINDRAPSSAAGVVASLAAVVAVVAAALL